MATGTTYIGRFAPTPSGPLHLGSVIAALASFLDARQQQGQWRLRIDNADRPRVVAGAADAILDSLDRLGLHWDGPVMYQDDTGHYRAALDRLDESGLLYRCTCPRRLTRGRPYPGTCRNLLIPASTGRHSLRVITSDETVRFRDAIQGDCCRNLRQDSGDFVIWRADGIVAYHLATVVDDARLGVTHIVRGADLLPATPSQVYLQQLLGLDTPAYAHIPVALDSQGLKLGKKHLARPALEGRTPAAVLVDALRFLGQGPGPELQHASAGEILDWAIANWNLTLIPRRMESAGVR